MRFQVPPEARGLLLGKFLLDRLKLSRTLIRRAKNSQGLLLDGVPVRTSQLLEGGELFELRVVSEGRVSPEPMDLSIVYEDTALLVVDKPSFVVVHPVRDYRSGTLANGVAWHLLQGGEEPVARPVQRIDRETSGLVLFAKEPAVAGLLAAELERNKVHRQYLAFVSGEIEGEAGTVDVPIRRVWGHPVARETAVGARTEEQEQLLADAARDGRVLRGEWTAEGQRAITHWKVERRWRSATLLSVALQTGRTHQIRVHMAHLGHPLLGDWLYGEAGPPGRQALHAATLVFRHPVTQEGLRLEAPLPHDLQALAAALDGGA